MQTNKFKPFYLHFNYPAKILSLSMHINFKKILKTPYFLLLFTLINPLVENVTAQNSIKKLVHNIFSSQKDSTRSATFMLLPALGYAQETGVEYGIGSTYNFYMDKADTSIRTSSLALIGTLTTKKQANIKLTSDLWTKNNDYHILSEIRYRDWPFNYYGIGTDTWKANQDYIEQRLFRIRLEVEKKIVPKFYVGLNAQFEDYKFKDITAAGIFEQDAVTGKRGGRHLLLGVSALYDSRNNVSYTTKGSYARLKYAYAPAFWKGEHLQGSQLDVDIRDFETLSSKWTLALQGIYRSTFGKSTPFYSYRELGGDMMMRGYYLGRYRDKHYAATQAEFRYRFHPRFALTGFGAAGSVFSKQHSFRLLPSFGGGIRYFFSLEHNSSVRFDYAYGEKRPGEVRQSGFYLSLSEAF